MIFAPWKLKHLITYFECIRVQLFWTNLSTLLQDYNVCIHFNIRNIMLGITEGTNQSEVQTKNFIILLGKHFIFKNKYKKQHPNLSHFKLYLKHRINIEKHIYFKKDRLAPIVGVCNCSLFCCALLYVHSSIAIILMRKRELMVLLNLSSWCLVMVERLFLAVPRGCLQFVIVVFPDHTHLLFLPNSTKNGETLEH